MTLEQAQAEALRRWGRGGAVRLRPTPAARNGKEPGRLARYRCTVGNHGLGRACSIEGQGDTWRAAFADVHKIALRVSIADDEAT